MVIACVHEPPALPQEVNGRLVFETQRIGLDGRQSKSPIMGVQPGCDEENAGRPA